MDNRRAGRRRELMVTRWIPPKVVWPESRDAYLRDGGKVLEFRGRG